MAVMTVEICLGAFRYFCLALPDSHRKRCTYLWMLLSTPLNDSESRKGPCYLITAVADQYHAPNQECDFHHPTPVNVSTILRLFLVTSKFDVSPPRPPSARSVQL